MTTRWVELDDETEVRKRLTIRAFDAVRDGARRYLREKREKCVDWAVSRAVLHSYRASDARDLMTYTAREAVICAFLETVFEQEYRG